MLTVGDEEAGQVFGLQVGGQHALLMDAVAERAHDGEDVLHADGLRGAGQGVGEGEDIALPAADIEQHREQQADIVVAVLPAHHAVLVELRQPIGGVGGGGGLGEGQGGHVHIASR